MTLFEFATVATSSVGLFVVAVSLFYVARQTALLRDQARESTKAVNVSASETMQGASILLVEAYLAYPTIRPLFNEDEGAGPVPELKEHDRLRANAIAEHLLDMFEVTMSFSEGPTGIEGNPYGKWIVHSFQNSDYLVQYAMRRRDWYDERLIAIATAATTPSENSAPQRPTEASTTAVDC